MPVSHLERAPYRTFVVAARTEKDAVPHCLYRDDADPCHPLTDLIVGRENHWARVYDPKRITLRAAPEFIRANVDVALQFKDYVVPAEVDDARTMPHDSGRIMRRNLNGPAAGTLEKID